MTMEECYTQMGANYHRVLRRLGKESLLVKIAEMFPQDESYNRMKAMMDQPEGNIELTMRAAHKFYGLCLNAGYANLSKVMELLVDALEDGDIEEAQHQLRRVTRQYNFTCKLLKDVDELKPKEDYCTGRYFIPRNRL